MPLDPVHVRSQFPALTSGAVFFDNPGGTQVPHQVIDRMVDHLVTKNANRGGAFATSMASDAIIEESRRAVADFLNAAGPDEIVFGPNMTTLTLGLSRALARELRPGGRDCRHPPRPRCQHCPLGADRGGPGLHRALGGLRRRGLHPPAGSARGSPEWPDPPGSGRIRIQRRRDDQSGGQDHPLARRANALCFVDAVQYAPHGSIDVQALGCDFLVVSAYKFFGPHLGALYGRREHLERLRPYKVRPAPNEPPDKFETGTGNHEGIAGTLGAVEYLAELGETQGGEHPERSKDACPRRRWSLEQAMSAIRAYEMELSGS